MNAEELLELRHRGWRITRDGSTATAQWTWDDLDEEADGWEVLVLHTSGHPPRFTLNLFESGLTERHALDLVRLQGVLTDARALLERWQGEVPDPE